ncbi:30636_t:CDS:1, partial [Gigaspora margarita]
SVARVAPRVYWYNNNTNLGALHRAGKNNPQGTGMGNMLGKPRAENSWHSMVSQNRVRMDRLAGKTRMYRGLKDPTN